MLLPSAERQFSTAIVRSVLSTIVVLILSNMLISCTGNDRPGSARAERAEEADGPITIGAAWPWEKMKGTLYRQGMQMAVDEVNANGGILGRTLQVERRDDEATVTKARVVAQQFADNVNMVAVIGHLQSFTTLPAAAIYDRAGLLLMAPTATDPDLTRKGYPLVFRSTFGNDMVGRALSVYAANKKYRRVAICYIANHYGRDLANAFETEATDHGIDIVSRQSYSPDIRGTSTNLRRIVSRWAREDIDAIFLAGEVPIAPMLMAAARERGVKADFIGGDALRIPRLLEIGGRAVEGTILPYRFHPSEHNAAAQRFTTAFRQRHGVNPDAGAALGYDSIHLLAQAIESAGSTVPAKIASALREGSWTGATGPYQFDETGNLLEASVKLMEVKDQEFVPLNPALSTADVVVQR